MKKVARPSTYSRMDGGIFRPHPAVYTKNDAKKLSAQFPKAHREVAFEEISQHVSVLLGCKFSNLTPEHVNRKDVKKKIVGLCAALRLVENLFGGLNQSTEFHAFKIKKAFYKLSNLQHAQKTLCEFPLSIRWLIRACDKALVTEDRSGTRHQHYFTAIRNLAAVWTKYKGQKPTRHSKRLPGAPGTEGGIQQKDGGPFIDFLNIALKPAAPHDASIPHIAKTIICAL